MTWAILILPSGHGFYRWHVHTPQGDRRGTATNRQDAWTLARLAKETLHD